MYLTAGYFAHLRSAATDFFEERYHAAFGETPPMQNDVASSCDEGLHSLAALSNHARSPSAPSLRRSIDDMPTHRSARSYGPSSSTRPIHLARVEGFEPRVIASL